MGHFPTGLRIKHTEEEEIAWDGYWAQWGKKQEKKKKRKKRKKPDREVHHGK